SIPAREAAVPNLYWRWLGNVGETEKADDRPGLLLSRDPTLQSVAAMLGQILVGVFDPLGKINVPAARGPQDFREIGAQRAARPIVVGDDHELFRLAQSHLERIEDIAISSLDIFGLVVARAGRNADDLVCREPSFHQGAGVNLALGDVDDFGTQNLIEIPEAVFDAGFRYEVFFAG